MIPDKECLIAPIAEHFCIVKERVTSALMFEIKLHHCANINWRNIIVRCGDFRNGIPFSRMNKVETFSPEKGNQYLLDEHLITIYTSHFCQFLCTVCGELCRGEIQALLFGALFTGEQQFLVHVSTLYLCGPLYSIRDFREKLCGMEKELAIPRHLIDTICIEWAGDILEPNTTSSILTKMAQWLPKFLFQASDKNKYKHRTLQACLKVNPEYWGPRDLRRPEVCWNEEGTLTETGNLLEKLSRGHLCKQAPYHVAQFSLQSRMPTWDCTYKQFKGLLQVVMRDGDDQHAISSMEINQLNHTYQATGNGEVLPPDGNDINELYEQYTQYFNTPLKAWHINRMAKYINTTWKLTSLAAELRMDKFQVEPYLENYKNVVEASFNFLVDWKQNVVCDETAWKQILYALRETGVFPNLQKLKEFCATLFETHDL